MKIAVLGTGNVGATIGSKLIEVGHTVMMGSRTANNEKAVAFAKKLKSGKGFDLNDFKEQIAQMRNMGGLTALMDKMPAQIAQAAGNLPAGMEAC